MTGAAIKGASVRIGDYNEPYVSVDFNASGARQFAQITGAMLIVGWQLSWMAWCALLP